MKMYYIVGIFEPGMGPKDSVGMLIEASSAGEAAKLAVDKCRGSWPEKCRKYIHALYVRENIPGGELTVLSKEYHDAFMG